MHLFVFGVAKTCMLSSGVVPVEVKAQTGATRSLDKLLADPAIPFGYKLTGGNVGVAGKKVTLPHYMAMFLHPMAEDNGLNGA